MTSQPMRKVLTVCPFCGLGDGLYLSCRGDEIVGLEYATTHPSEGALCSRGNSCYEIVQREDRLTKPLLRGNGEFRKASWTEALKFTANSLRDIKRKHGSKAIGVFSSAKITNEEAYVLQKFARRVLGTNNIDNSVRLCHAPTVECLTEIFGLPYATGTTQQLEHSDCILIVGANPCECTPTLARRILRARDRGAKVIVVDPRRTRTTWHSDIHLMINPASDVELILSFINCITSSKLEKKEFVEGRVINLDKLLQTCSKFTPEAVEKIVGVSARQIREAAITFALAKTASIIYSHGVTQHTSGTNAVKALASLAAVTGNLGRLGAGIYPLIDQNNMQGVCDIGALPNFESGYVKVVEKGLTLVEMVEAAKSGSIKAIYIVGMNPVASFPNQNMVRDALSCLKLLVVQDIFMTETSGLAHVVLPAACWAELDGTFTSMDRRVQRVSKAVSPIGEALEGWKIICGLAEQMGEASGFNYGSWDEIFSEIVSEVPQYSGLNVEKVSAVGGAIIPDGTEILYKEKFMTEHGKAKLAPIKYELIEKSRETEYQYVMITGKTLFHHGSGSMTRRMQFPMSEIGEVFVEISSEDAGSIGVKDGALVCVKSKLSELYAKAKLSRIKKGVVFIPYHFPGKSPNRLIQVNLDPQSKGPELKHTPVSVRRVS